MYWLGCAQLFLQFVVQMVFCISAVASGITEDTILNQWLIDKLLITTIISNLLFVFIAVLICKIRKVNIKEDWKITKLNAKSYFMPCVIAFTYSMFYSLITYDATANASAATHISANHYSAFAIPMLALALLASAPVTEEIMCRGIMLNTLKKSFSAKVAIIVSSAIFGVMHIMAGGITLAIGAFVMGLVLAIIYEKTSSLHVAIVAHTIANIPDFILYTSPQINDILRIALAISLLVISIICLLVWCKPKEDR